VLVKVVKLCVRMFWSKNVRVEEDDKTVYGIRGCRYEIRGFSPALYIFSKALDLSRCTVS
jgi:hypothetical protein